MNESARPKIDTGKDYVEVLFGASFTTLPHVENIRDKMRTQFVALDPEYDDHFAHRRSYSMHDGHITDLRQMGVEFFALKAEESGLPDNSVNTIRMTNVLNRADNPSDILREAVRIVKPALDGGVIYVAADNTPNIFSLRDIRDFAKRNSLECDVLIDTSWSHSLKDAEIFDTHTYGSWKSNGVGERGSYLVQLKKKVVNAS